MRVVKTYTQTSLTPIGYGEAAMRVVRADGVLGLFTRGLGTKLITNGIQGVMFTVAWKYFQEQWEKKEAAEDARKKAGGKANQ